MKTKEYAFTEIEMLAIRDALHFMKTGTRFCDPLLTPNWIERDKAVVSLYDQFKEDYSNI